RRTRDLLDRSIRALAGVPASDRPKSRRGKKTSTGGDCRAPSRRGHVADGQLRTRPHTRGFARHAHRPARHRTEPLARPVQILNWRERDSRHRSYVGRGPFRLRSKLRRTAGAPNAAAALGWPAVAFGGGGWTRLEAARAGSRKE